MPSVIEPKAVRRKIKIKTKPEPEPEPEPEPAVWTPMETCYHDLQPLNTIEHPKLAIFDLDATLQELGSDIALDEMITAFKEWYHKGYNMVVMSNQYGISKQKTTHEVVQQRFQELSTTIGPDIPVSYMYSTCKDKYRKPMTGMYDAFKSIHEYDMHHEDSFYCGDAAGRTSDFAVSDHYFALNCGLKFYQSDGKSMGPFKKTQISKKFTIYNMGKGDLPPTGKALNILRLDKWLVPAPDTTLPDGPIVIMLIGPPGSGKSTLAAKLQEQHPYLHILNRDTIGSTPKLQSMFNKHMHMGESVILDNLNNIEDKREYYLDRVSDSHRVIAYHFDIPKELSFHLCHLRVQQSGRYVPPVVRYTYYTQFTDITIDDVRVIKGFPVYDSVPPEYYYYYNLKDR
jgi:bifunctional polynucleotide phosphatase/kinase